jgi:hypothetical protein
MLDTTGAEVQTPRDKAEYIERMARELSRLASLSGLPFLSYLLDMAAEEAAQSTPDARVLAHGRPPTAADLDRGGAARQK